MEGSRGTGVSVQMEIGDSPMRASGEELASGMLDHNGDRIIPAVQGSSLGRNGDLSMEGDDHLDLESSDRDMDAEDDSQEEQDEMDEYDEDILDDANQDEVTKAFYRDRTVLYEKLLEFFAEEVKQPKGDLTDLVKVG